MKRMILEYAVALIYISLLVYYIHHVVVVAMT